MSEKQQKKEHPKEAAASDVPQLFRLNIEVGDLESAISFYFTVSDLEAIHERAGALGCISREDVHDQPAGGILVRPWGERSFYVEDPWRNPLCFVEEGTVYTG